MLLAVDIQPHRSPTRRHMHNYSLPSPSALVPTARSPTRCQSSPTLTDFREAIYIPETRLTHSRTAVAVASTSRTPSLRTAVSNPSLLGWRADESRLAKESPRLSPTQTRSASAMASPYYSKYYTPSPTPPARAITFTKKLKSRTPILKRLSTLSLRALPIPLPTPPEEGSETAWTIDPFAAPSTATRRMPLEPVPQSKWSPASSTSSLVVEETTPTKKLKNLLGRLSIHKTQPSVLKDSSASRRSSVTTFVAVDSEPSLESAEGITTISKPAARQPIELRRPSNEGISLRKNREHRSVLEKARPRHNIERVANELANAHGQVTAANENSTLGRSVKERSHPQTVFKTQFPSSAGQTTQSSLASPCFVTSQIQTATAPSRCTHSPLPGSPPNATPCAPSISGQPPAIPPRSKLRPPPVKILPLSRSYTTSSFSNSPGPGAQCFEAPLEEALIKSGFTSCSPPISPLPTPPMLSPTTTSPIHSPATINFPATPEPRLDLPICKEVDAKMNAKSAAIAREEAYLRRLVTCGRGSIPEFFSQEEPRPPPSRLSYHTSRERDEDDSETDDEAVEFYAMYSTHFRPRTPSFTRRRVPSLRRKNSRSERRSLATSMVSIYSQASAALSPEDLMDLPPVPALPWSLRRDPDHAETRPPTPPLQPTVARTPPRASPLSSPPASPDLFTDEWRGLLLSRNIRQKQPSRHSTNASVTSVVDISVSGCLPTHEPDTVVPALRRDTFLPWRQQTFIRPMRTASERQTKSMLSRMTGLKNRLQVFSLSFRSSTSPVAASSMRSSKAAPWLSPADAARLQSNVIHITRSSFALHSS
uniref:Uncharacterized protein n=1 Tax=Mycena chlorophos TaxID=658473 RepID=A0ABQ0KZ84_MYCCL|nr:predicted protein [Mycena chlorophos]